MPDPPESTERPGTRRPDLLLVVVLGVLWGSAFPVIRYGLVAGAPPLLFAAVRYSLTAAILVPIAFVARSPRSAAASMWSPAVFGGLLMIGGYGGLLYLGEESTSGGLAAILTASAPLASALFGSGLLPAERLGRWAVAGLLVGFGGVAVLVLPQLGHPFASGFAGPVLVVSAVLVFALGSVLLRRTATVAPTLWSLALQFAVAGALLGAVGVGIGEPITLGHAAMALPSLAFLVIVPGVLGYALYFRIHHRSGPTRANLVGYVNPVAGVLVGLLVFGETVTALEIAGMGLIALGLFMLHRDSP